MATTKKIQFGSFEWTDIMHPGQAEIEQLRKYNFHPLDLRDCLIPVRRNKIDTYPTYTFLVTLWPAFDRTTREIVAGEVDVFIGKNFLITLHHEKIPVLQDIFQLYQTSAELRGKFVGETPERLLYELLNRHYSYVFPMVDHLITDCDAIEKAIFSGDEKKMVSEILIIRRNIIDCRKVMQAHKNVLKRAITSFKENHNFKMKKTDVYFESLIGYTKEIWDQLDNLKERIEALQETNESQISFKLSDIMRILTIISVITFPVTLTAAIFGMNILNIPLGNNPYGFWIILAMMLAIVASMLGVFKKKGWL